MADSSNVRSSCSAANNDGVRPTGRLRERIDLWRSIGTSSFVLSVIRQGYFLPFTSIPPVSFASNHASTKKKKKHASFVSHAIKELLDCGSITRVMREAVHICSPLGVVEQSKLRLILDLRRLNEFLRKPKFKYDDVRTAATIFEKGDYFRVV